MLLVDLVHNCSKVGLQSFSLFVFTIRIRLSPIHVADFYWLRFGDNCFNLGVISGIAFVPLWFLSAAILMSSPSPVLISVVLVLRFSFSVCFHFQFLLLSISVFRGPPLSLIP